MGSDAEAVDAAARVGLGELLLTGCTTTTDHLYLFPRGQERLIDAEIAAARDLGIRFHPTRGSMSRGQSQGGLPPDDMLPGRSTRSCATRSASSASTTIPGPRAMTRIALAPCAPFSVSDDLMRRTAELAREHWRPPAHPPGRDPRRGALLPRGLRLPARSSTCAGWAGSAPTCGSPTASTSRRKRCALFGETGTGVAHCPSSNFRLGSGIAPVRALLDAGVPVGLGVDGSASNDTLEHDGRSAPGAPRPPPRP